MDLHGIKFISTKAAWFHNSQILLHRIIVKLVTMLASKPLMSRLVYGTFLLLLSWFTPALQCKNAWLDNVNQCCMESLELNQDNRNPIESDLLFCYQHIVNQCMVLCLKWPGKCFWLTWKKLHGEYSSFENVGSGPIGYLRLLLTSWKFLCYIKTG